MLPVSAEWQEANRQQFRNQAYLRCTIKVTPPGLSENKTVQSANTEVVSTLDVFDKEIRQDVTPYATFEHNRWIHNGTFKVLSLGTKTDDWWSTTVDANRTLKFQFDKQYDIPGLWITWDVVSKTYPGSITVVGRQGDTVVSTTDVSNINSYVGFIPVELNKVDGVDLIIHRWTPHLWRARINELIFGVYTQYDSFNNGRIEKATSIDRSDFLSQKLPTHTMVCTLQNYDLEFDPLLQKGTSRYLAQRQLVQFEWGFAVVPGVITWGPKMNYFLNPLSVPPDSKTLEISSTSRLAFATDEYVWDIYSGNTRTLRSLALRILKKSNLITTYEGEEPWELSSKLSQQSSTAPIPKKPCNALLQLIAAAAGLCLLTDPVTGYVKIEDPSTESSQSVGLGQQLGDPQFELVDPLKSISVSVYNYIVSDQQSKLSEGTYRLDSTTTLSMSYNVGTATNVSAEITNGTIVSVEYFSTRAELVVSPILPTADVVVVIMGYEVKGTPTYVTTYDDTAVANGLVVKVENPFITDTLHVQRISDNVKYWLTKRQRYSIPYVGYPETTALDKVDLTTVYGSTGITVTGNTIDFNGGWDGTLEGL